MYITGKSKSHFIPQCCKENRTTQSRFFCIECGHTQNVDINASLNILMAGHAILACGDIKPITA
ncbi:MAG: transposase [Deltaproteobacteria bacterium]|nr:transposase [Deltaproteobacteria bacterium]